MKRKAGETAGKRLSSAVMCAPMTVWAVLFILLPVAILIFMSFMSKGLLGLVQMTPTLANYQQVADPIYLKIVEQSLFIAFMTTVITVLMGYPLAYFIAQKPTETANKLLLLIMIPFWASELVLIYSFVILFNNDGLINDFLLMIGVIHKPLALLYNNFSVVVGMIYMFLPFAVLPMYSSIEKLDKSLLEASSDLGANPVTSFFRLTLPLTSPGIFAAVILVFIPTIGYYVVTDALGGGTSIMIGNVIYNQFTSASNWPFGAALSVILAAVILVMVFVYTKIGGDMDSLGA